MYNRKSETSRLPLFLPFKLFEWLNFALCFSPLYIDSSANLDIATKRILWGKCINAGQTCIAPDYILCTKEIQEKFVQKAKKVLLDWYGSNPQTSPDLCRIVSNKHFQWVLFFLKIISKDQLPSHICNSVTAHMWRSIRLVTFI